MSKKSGRLRIEYRSPHELRPRADNAKVHSPQQIKKLEKSIKRFGFLNPVLISDDDEIIAGHGRVEAAKRGRTTADPNGAAIDPYACGAARLQLG